MTKKVVKNKKEEQESLSVGSVVPAVEVTNPLKWPLIILCGVIIFMGVLGISRQNDLNEANARLAEYTNNTIVFKLTDAEIADLRRLNIPRDITSKTLLVDTIQNFLLIKYS